MEDPKLDTILDRVRALLAVAESTTYPEEAATFAARAQALMFRYSLTQAQLDAKRPGEGDEYITDDWAVPDSRKRTQGWKRVLCDYVARNNFCSVVYYRARPRVAFIGRRHNVEAVEYLTAYLIREIERLAGVAWREAVADGSAGAAWKTWHANFCQGAALTVGRRLRK